MNYMPYRYEGSLYVVILFNENYLKEENGIFRFGTMCILLVVQN